MTELEFEQKFDKGDLDAEFCDFICDRYDAINKEHMLRLWEDDNVFASFKEHMVTSTMLQDAYFDGVNPLNSFPTIRGGNK